MRTFWSLRTGNVPNEENATLWDRPVWSIRQKSEPRPKWLAEEVQAQQEQRSHSVHSKCVFVILRIQVG